MAAAAQRGPVIVWSDAMWEDAAPGRPARGGLGFVVWLPPGTPLSTQDGRFLYSARDVGLDDLPFLDRQHSLIGQCELLAAVSVYVSIPPVVFTDVDVIHFVDNSSALYGLVKGYSGLPDSLAIIRALHAANLALRANLWFNYVASHANIGDLPSRGATSDLISILRSVLTSFEPGRDSVELALPACPRDVHDLWTAVSAQLCIGSGAPTPPPPSRSRSAGGAARRRRRRPASSSPSISVPLPPSSGPER